MSLAQALSDHQDLLNAASFSPVQQDPAASSSSSSAAAAAAAAAASSHTLHGLNGSDRNDTIEPQRWNSMHHHRHRQTFFASVVRGDCEFGELLL